MKSSDYYLRLEWLRFQPVKDTTTGEVKPTYKLSKLWGTYDQPKPHEKIYYGSLGQAIDIKMVFNGVPGIIYADKFRYGSAIYNIVSIYETASDTTVWAVQTDKREGTITIV